MALAADDDPLEHLRAPAGALDDLEVNPQAIAGAKRRHSAELCALQAVDHGAHKGEVSRGNGVRRRPAGACKRTDPAAGADYGSGPPRGSVSPGCALAARARLWSRLHWRILAWWPDSSTSGTSHPRCSAGRV